MVTVMSSLSSFADGANETIKDNGNGVTTKERISSLMLRAQEKRPMLRYAARLQPSAPHHSFQLHLWNAPQSRSPYTNSTEPFALRELQRNAQINLESLQNCKIAAKLDPYAKPLLIEDIECSRRQSIGMMSSFSNVLTSPLLENSDITGTALELTQTVVSDFPVNAFMQRQSTRQDERHNASNGPSSRKSAARQPRHRSATPEFKLVDICRQNESVGGSRAPSPLRTPNYSPMRPYAEVLADKEESNHLTAEMTKSASEVESENGNGSSHNGTLQQDVCKNAYSNQLGAIQNQCASKQNCSDDSSSMTNCTIESNASTCVSAAAVTATSTAHQRSSSLLQQIPRSSVTRPPLSHSAQAVLLQNTPISLPDKIASKPSFSKFRSRTGAAAALRPVIFNNDVTRIVNRHIGKKPSNGQSFASLSLMTSMSKNHAHANLIDEGNQNANGHIGPQISAANREEALSNKITSNNKFQSSVKTHQDAATAQLSDNEEDDVCLEDTINGLDDDIVEDENVEDDKSSSYCASVNTSRPSSSASTHKFRRINSCENLASETSTIKRPSRSKSATNFGYLHKDAMTKQNVTLSDKKALSPLIHSLFSHTPPVINFVTENERVELLPFEYRKLLKWRMSTITPLVVKRTILRSGFRVSKMNSPSDQLDIVETHDWLGYFGKHMKADGFRSIREHQKVNHFPGSFQIGRKDRLWKNLYKMQVRFGKTEYDFFPLTFCLPGDSKAFKRYWEDGGQKFKWIIKPPASARGNGIRVVSKWQQIPKKRSVVVQRYLHKPYLINDSKFDLRIYVYVTSLDPLRIYLYPEGLVRFASCKYSSSARSLSNRFMHLTNYSVNKCNSEYVSNNNVNVAPTDAAATIECHKWTLEMLWTYLRRQGVNTTSIWEEIRDLVVKTILAGESCINSQVKMFARRRACVHELFGFDVLLDESLRPWILEVNISPSLHSNSALDIAVKGPMIKDFLNLAGFQIPEKKDLGVDGPQMNLSNYEPSSPYVSDKRLWNASLSLDERAKHAFFVQRHQDLAVQNTLLDTLTPDDVRILCESIDEGNRAGRFERVFPTSTSSRYLRFFEQPRYYNLLLNAYLQRYDRMEIRGVAMLDALCLKRLHLQNPTTELEHIWNPGQNSNSTRESSTASATRLRVSAAAVHRNERTSSKGSSRLSSIIRSSESTSLSNAAATVTK